MTQNINSNAGIFFAVDGYDPASKGINGRRVAGESFIRGYLRHADVAEFVPLVRSNADRDLFAKFASEERPKIPVRYVAQQAAPRMAPLTTLFYPSPNFLSETWRRAPFGHAAWAICGITHTTSTKAVMQGMFDLRMSPQMEWDSVICTSRAVQASMVYQMELIDDHIRQRFNTTPPARPLMPIIPLGVDAGAFAPDQKAGRALRAKLGVGPKDVVFSTIARLTPYEKFDPLPLYIALAAAQKQMPKGQKLHLVLCGIYRDDYSRKVFEEGAKGLMPDVGFHVLDGADAALRKAVLSGSDAFLFVIDNIQETFGLAPIEAMAAGLPVIASDWDGLRDTVSPDVGIRVPTQTLTEAHSDEEAYRYMTGSDSYTLYCALASAMTEVNVPDLTRALLRLAQNPDLRRTMGDHARKRARSVYDWSRVIPQMQDLWHEQAMRRAAALRFAPKPIIRAHIPIGPSPFGLFSAYPTRQGGFDGERFIAVSLEGRPDVAKTLALRDYAALGRAGETEDFYVSVHQLVDRSGTGGVTRDDIARHIKIPVKSLDRVLIWLLKYDFIRRMA